MLSLCGNQVFKMTNITEYHGTYIAVYLNRAPESLLNRCFKTHQISKPIIKIRT